MDARIRPVPQQRIRDRMDDYMSRRDYAGAERHLLYWLNEARAGGDQRGELMVLNELVGHYRKTAERDKAMACAADAVKLLDALDMRGSISEGTTCVNIATMMNAFGENAQAIALFGRAREAYESSPATEPQLLGGLYNNMALTCVALRRYDDAEALYEKAMAQMGRAQYGELEQAITCLNMANLIEDRDGMETGEARIYDLLDRASALLDTEGIPHDGYYAFVCEKCAPTFEYYGYFADAQRYTQESKLIYEGH